MGSVAGAELGLCNDYLESTESLTRVWIRVERKKRLDFVASGGRYTYHVAYSYLLALNRRRFLVRRESTAPTFCTCPLLPFSFSRSFVSHILPELEFSFFIFHLLSFSNDIQFKNNNNWHL